MPYARCASASWPQKARNVIGSGVDGTMGMDHRDNARRRSPLARESMAMHGVNHRPRFGFSRWRSSTDHLLALGFATLTALGCGSEPDSNGPTIRIGASLPFSGTEAALGGNLEQALLLAIEDVNNAGGIDGVSLELVATDSNSGSERGLTTVRALISDGEISALVGPEESELASAIVTDVKEADLLNVLPGFAAPVIQRATTSGGWLHLAPGVTHLGCALAGYASADHAENPTTLSSREDFNMSLASAFASKFRSLADVTVPAVTASEDQSSYSDQLARTASYQPDKTLLIASPRTASHIVTEWAVLGSPWDWYLSPLLRAESFLRNVPPGVLEGQFGMSPSLSLTSECELLEGYDYGPVSCERANAQEFVEHFTDRWGTSPFPAAHLYYDAVVLLALGMQYAAADGDSPVPTGQRLRDIIADLNSPSNPPAYWNDLPRALSKVKSGTKLRYVGTGAEYDLSEYGTAQHVLFDGWTVRNKGFVVAGTYYARCWTKEY